MTQKPRRPNIRSPIHTRSGLQLPQTIVAVDPGRTTGLAAICPNKPLNKVIQVFQFSHEEHRELATKLRGLSPANNPAIIIYEQYVARPSRHGLVGAEAQKALSPVFIHGYMVGLMEACRNPPQMPTFVPQQASEMASFPDKRIKSMFSELYALTLAPATPHARDALRHLLVYLKRHHFNTYQSLKWTYGDPAEEGDED
jgi:hypothetical protein